MTFAVSYRFAVAVSARASSIVRGTKNGRGRPSSSLNASAIGTVVFLFRRKRETELWSQTSSRPIAADKSFPSWVRFSPSVSLRSSTSSRTRSSHHGGRSTPLARSSDSGSMDNKLAVPIPG